jgi:hypothetical protein
MVELVNLSAAGKSIVEKYLSGSILLEDKNKKQLVASLYSMSDDAKPEVLGIVNPFVVNLNDSLTEDDILILRNEFKAVVRYCHTKKSPDLGYTRSSDDNPLLIPDSMLELCNQLLEIKVGSEVFLPYSATAQLAFKNPEAKYAGFETGAETWAFSQIYLQCFRIDADIKLTGNMSDALPEGKLYDYIFSFPPFLMGREGRTVIDNIYHLATKSLKEGGTLCCILPLTFCTATSGWFDIRKILWDYKNQYSAAVISLPRPLLFPSTSIATCMFILTKNNQGNIVLVDASSESFCARHDVAGDKEFELKVQSIIETIQKCDERYVWGGNVSDLVGDVNLLPSRYLISRHLPHPKKGERLMPLRDLVDITSLQRNTGNEDNSPLLGIKELSSNYLNCDIKASDIPLRQAHHFGLLTQDCLLAGFIGGRFKVGRSIDFSTKNAVALRPEVIPFKLKSDAVIEDFLLRSIMSDNVARQGQMMSTGVTISRIKKQDFLDLKIIVPTLEEQERICKADTKQSLSDVEVKQQKVDDDFRRDMHMKKHAIGQTIFNLNNWWKQLLRARKEGNGIVDDNAVIGNFHKVAVSDIYENIQNAINQLQQQISKLDRGNGLVTENISLTQFIEDYIAKHKSPIFQYKYDKAAHYTKMMVDMEEVYDDKGNLIGVKGGREEEVTFENAVFAPEALTIVFDNIVSNACSHGFAGREANRDGNIIKIELTTDGTDHVITISNNGKPVGKGVNEDYVFTYNRSTQNGKNHYGIGGYEVKHLMREFDGDAEFVSAPDDAFPVKYKLVFHNTGIENINLGIEEQ